MLITRRLANVNKTGLALSDHIFLFRMRLPNDIEYCEDLLGSKDDAAMLPKLANYEYLYMDSESNVKKCPPLRLKA